MNERIKKIWDKAAESTAAFPSGQNNSWETQVNFMEKFAELIVRECIDVISPYAVRMENFDGGHPIADLKKHFGVEEHRGWVCPKCGTDRTKAECPNGHMAAIEGKCPMVIETQGVKEHFGVEE